MIEIHDGPAAGRTFACRRAPTWLRVTHSTGEGWDALDAIDDEPRPDEQIHVYRLTRRGAGVFVCTRGSRSSAGGFYPDATYAHVPDIDGEAVRDTLAWRQWCADRAGVPLEVALESLEHERAR